MKSKKRNAASAALAFLLLTALPVTAFAQELTVGGQIVGIQISTDGVMVAGIGPVETAEGSRSPAEEAGVKEGDLVKAINGTPVTGASALIAAVGALNGEPARLTLLRGKRELEVEIQPVLSTQQQWMLGLWLRDGVTGIGTVTFCDPVTGIFGALGHGVSDEGGGRALPMSDGHITEAEILDVIPGTAGAPGELSGCTDVGRVLGRVEKNTDHGVYGHMLTPPVGRVVQTGEMDLGPAIILSTVSGRETREYRAAVSRLYRDSGGKHAMITITDSELCSVTGGIVQGMSGSPILQNGKLVGAVTHVFVNDPTRGYAISIQDMLDDAGITEKAA